MKRSANLMVEQLRAWPGLEPCRDDELVRLAKLVDRVELPAGWVLTREGCVAREAFMILDGTAQVSIGSEVVGTVGPGRFVGEMALLENDVRTATVTALTPMTVLVLAPRQFRAMLRQPEIAIRIGADLARRVRRLEGAPTLHAH